MPLCMRLERGWKHDNLSSAAHRMLFGNPVLVDDLILGQGSVLSRAATSVQSIQSNPLSQAFGFSVIKKKDNEKR